MDAPADMRRPFGERDFAPGVLAARRPPSRQIGGSPNQKISADEAARELRRRLVERIGREVTTGAYQPDARRVAEALVRARIPFLFGTNH